MSISAAGSQLARQKTDGTKPWLCIGDILSVMMDLSGADASDGLVMENVQMNSPAHGVIFISGNSRATTEA